MVKLIGKLSHKITITLAVLLFMIQFEYMCVYGQENNTKHPEQLYPIGSTPFQLSSKIDIGMIIASASILLATVAIILNTIQMKNTKGHSETQFWLVFREFVNKYHNVHLKLRSRDEDWPSTKEEWIEVEGYLGLFEHCYPILKAQLIDKNMFKSIYGYRIKNILYNKEILSKIAETRNDGWENFIKLVNEFIYKKGKIHKDLELVACLKDKKTPTETINITDGIMIESFIGKPKIHHNELQTLLVIASHD
jgi:hypothetical protein